MSGILGMYVFKILWMYYKSKCILHKAAFKELNDFTLVVFTNGRHASLSSLNKLISSYQQHHRPNVHH